MRRQPQLRDENLSIPHLEELIGTMRDWSMKRPWTKAQLAAWRLRWFGQTPEQDARDREEYYEQRQRELRNGFDRYARREQDPFIDWPNGQGV
jgi:hypothetical protein